MTHPHTKLLKVGISKDVNLRAKTIATAVGMNMEILYESPPIDNAKYFEQIVLDRFKEQRTVGEWMLVDKNEILTFVKLLSKTFVAADYKCLWAGSNKELEAISYTQVESKLIQSQKFFTKIDEYTYKDEQDNLYIKYKQGEVIQTVKAVNNYYINKVKVTVGDRIIPFLQKSV